MRFAARFLLSFFLVILFSCITSVKVSAQTQIPTETSSSAQINPYTVPNTNPDVPNNLHTWTQNVLIETMAAVTCQLAGIDPVNPKQECLGVDQKTGKIGFIQNGGGAIGIMKNAIGMLYTPPINTGEYFHSIASNFGITKHAYAQAQGTGFQSLQPLMGLWTAFRNIAYLLFVIVFVVIGLAIMLRVKIDPRTVMTIQNQIPKMIVGILLVTFSFAIAGFLIDIMYTSIYLTGNAIVGTDTIIQSNEPDLVKNITSSTSPFAAANDIGGAGGGKGGGLSNIAWEPATVVTDHIRPIFDNVPGRIIMGILGVYIGSTVGKNAGNIVAGVAKVATVGLGFILAPFTGGASIPVSVGVVTALNSLGTIGSVVGGAAGVLLGPEITSLIVSIIVFLIIAIALLWALFRLWFALISAYLFLLLDVVFAPFWIVAGLIPGSPVGFGLWIRDIVANLAAFPTTIIMFLLARVMIDAFGTSGGSAFVPPLIGNLNGASFGPIIGLGMILLTPGVVTMTKTALKAPKFDTTPLKQSLGVGAGAVNLPGQAANMGAKFYMMNQAKQGIKGLPVIGGFFGGGKGGTRT